MSNLQLLTVAEIVALIAALAIYLFIVGKQLTQGIPSWRRILARPFAALIFMNEPRLVRTASRAPALEPLRTASENTALRCLGT